jgi:hypothetical protein
VSPDKKQLAFTYTGNLPVTIVLPIEGAVGLQRQLANACFCSASASPPTAQAPEGAHADRQSAR